MILVFMLASTVASAEPTPEPEDVTEIQRIVGPPTSVFIGFGLGHVVEGRWHERGWIFTTGELLALVPLVYGAAQVECETHCTLPTVAYVTGGLSLLGLRVWESIDSITGAKAKHWRNVRWRMGLAIAPARVGSGAVAGVAMRF